MNDTDTPDSIRTAPEVRDFLDHLRKTDCNGWCAFTDYLDDCEDEREERELLCQGVRATFEARLENESPLPGDIEDKRGALDRLDRSSRFDRRAFVATLREVVNYALRDRHPEE